MNSPAIRRRKSRSHYYAHDKTISVGSSALNVNGDSFWNKYYKDNVNLIAGHIPIASLQLNKIIMIHRSNVQEMGIREKIEKQEKGTEFDMRLEFGISALRTAGWGQYINRRYHSANIKRWDGT